MRCRCTKEGSLSPKYCHKEHMSSRLKVCRICCQNAKSCPFPQQQEGRGSWQILYRQFQHFQLPINFGFRFDNVKRINPLTDFCVCDVFSFRIKVQHNALGQTICTFALPNNFNVDFAFGKRVFYSKSFGCAQIVAKVLVNY